MLYNNSMHFITVKNILTSNGGTGINVYRGCTHGCIYCDSRSLCYKTPVPFEDIEVKENAVELLRSSLSKKRKRMMIGTGSMCDPYIPIEKELKITRGCLEAICDYDFGASVLTKSDLVLRDFDLLEKINRKTKAVLQMTLTTADENLCRIIEPNVCTTSRRFEVLMEAKKSGIPTVVWMCPFLPYINDTWENISSILDMCIRAGVKGIMLFGVGLTLREGNREYFYKNLSENFPGLKEKYIRSFGSSYEIASIKQPELLALIDSTCRKNGILSRADDVFGYLNSFEEREIQLSLF